jgi:hypothetical protein
MTTFFSNAYRLIAIALLFSSGFAVASNCENCGNTTCPARFALVLNNPELKSKIKIEDLNYEKTTLSGKGYTIKASQGSLSPAELARLKQEPAAKTITDKWDLKNFAQPRMPALVADASPNFGKTKLPRVLELPLKTSGMDTFAVPIEFSSLDSELKQILKTESELNPDFKDYYAYLTIDQGEVKKGVTQRRGGIHVDGFQGSRQPEKYAVDHSYVISDDVPTVFYQQPFETQHLEDGKHNFFLEMDRQLDERNAVSATPKKIYLMDAYTLHRADMAKKDTHRTFMRVLFSKHRYDRLGETENPLIPAWPREKRGIDTTLTLPESNAENFLGHGFVPESAAVTPNSAHISKLLSPLATSPADTIIAKGEIPEALKKLADNGWTIGREISKANARLKIYEVTHRSGAKANAIVGIDSPERLIQIHGMLKSSGKDPASVYTIGKFHPGN